MINTFEEYEELIIGDSKPNFKSRFFNPLVDILKKSGELSWFDEHGLIYPDDQLDNTPDIYTKEEAQWIHNRFAKLNQIANSYENLDDFVKVYNKTLYAYLEKQLKEMEVYGLSNENKQYIACKIALSRLRFWFFDKRINIETVEALWKFEHIKLLEPIVWRDHSIAFIQNKDSVPFARLISPNVENKSLTHPFNLGLYKSQSEPTAVYETLLMFATSGKTLNPRDYPNIKMNAMSKRISRCNEWLMEKFKLDEKPISAFSKKKPGYTIKIKITLENRGGGKDAMDLVDDNYSNPDSDSLF